MSRYNRDHCGSTLYIPQNVSQCDGNFIRTIIWSVFGEHVKGNNMERFFSIYRGCKTGRPFTMTPIAFAGFAESAVFEP